VSCHVPSRYSSDASAYCCVIDKERKIIISKYPEIHGRSRIIKFRKKIPTENILYNYRYAISRAWRMISKTEFRGTTISRNRFKFNCNRFLIKKNLHEKSSVLIPNVVKIFFYTQRQVVKVIVSRCFDGDFDRKLVVKEKHIRSIDRYKKHVAVT